ncbi:AurF N-oxygenase family protein [Actinocrispum wychmicini]|uniref:Para-aminobenzoate N-oxygenase AurF n=1 Tax=Actinocrispum wychmicini TaxID=1213861 RepID=A0A4R2IN03_9PSEU|nr:diiron oxygenase [Actinocrispum wychmicini]TCO46611.1 para-aminobenzoate N-oxygenase AurF [Actinocrispum wychmicini]
MTDIERELTAERLLNGSVRRSYDSSVDIDWDAPLVPGKYFLPPEISPLYGTPMWNALTPTQRIELSRQELANLLSVGHWFENILNQALLRMIFAADPTSKYTHYALTEIGDECRHMLMFGRLIEKIGARPFRQHPVQLAFTKLAPLRMHGLQLWVWALIGEEIFDVWQRRMMDEDGLQPVVRRMMRIHVVEEARHIQWARDGVARRMRHASRLERELVGRAIGIGGPFMRDQLVHPGIYRRAGLDGDEAYRQAMANPHHKRVKVEGFDRLRRFLEDQDVFRGKARERWRAAGFIE